MHVRRLTAVAFAAIALTASIASGQFIEDSINAGEAWVASLVYNPTANVIYGTSQSSMDFFTISCDSNRVISHLYRNEPLGIVYDSIGNKAYFSVYTTGDMDSVVVVSGQTHHRIGAIPLLYANGLAWDPVRDRLYVSRTELNLVSVIDCQADTVICDIPVSGGPMNVTVGTYRDRLYVTGWDDETVTIINTATNQAIRTIPLGGTPYAACYSMVAHKYYCAADANVVVIDAASDSVVAAIPLVMYTLSMLGVEDSRLVFVGGSNGSSHYVQAISTRYDSVVSTLAVGRDPEALCWSPVSGLVYCANASSDNVSVIAGDGSRVIVTLQVGDAPSALACATGAGRVYVGHSNTGKIYVIRDSATGITEESAEASTREAPLRARPNPFRTATRLEFPADEAGGTMRIYSGGGELVRELRLSREGVGWQSVWDGRGAGGRDLPAGVYLLVTQGSPSMRCKVVKTR